MAAVSTIKDVARAARVSTATVSAVINGSSQVSAPLKARVLEAVADLAYAPSGIARSLRTRATRLVGLIVADITNPFFAELVRAVGSAAQRLGYSLLLCESDHDPKKELAALQLLGAHRADGIILAPTGPADIYFAPPVSNFARPLLMVDRIITDAPFDTVSIDNRRAAFELTRHMLSLGHRRLAIVAGARHLSNTVNRLEGFRDAMASARLEVAASDIVYADFREDRARALCRKLLGSKNRPTALLASNNQMLIGAMQAMADLGLSCPRDVSITGIDDFPWADVFAPKLTTQRQPITALAENAVRILHARILGQRPTAPERVTLSTELVIRESCAPPPHGASMTLPQPITASMGSPEPCTIR